MGQQQLLLVILVTVIVGIATVVAINTFSSASEAANRDAVTNDVVAIAAAAQSFYIKPKMLNGGGSSFVGLDFSKIAFAGIYDNTVPLEAMNVNGFFVMGVGTASNFTITAHPASCTGYAGVMSTDASGNSTIGAKGNNCATADQIIATVGPNNIIWTSAGT